MQRVRLDHLICECSIDKEQAVDVLCSAYNSVEEDSRKFKVVISISVGVDESSFSFNASRSQAALYVHLSEKIKIHQCASFDSIKHVQDLCGFFIACRNPPVLAAELKKHNAGKEEALFADEYIPIVIKNFVDSSYSYTVSLSGANLKTAKSVLVEEMLACLHFYTEFQTKSAGFFDRFVPHLVATQVLNLFRNFSGEVGGYFTRKVPLQKLFWTNHGGNREEALFSPYNPSLLSAIDKRKCLIDPAHVALTVAVNDELHDFNLQVGNNKVDLKSHATTKRNPNTDREKTYLKVKAVTIKEKQTTHTIPCNVQYLFPNQDVVSPTVNAKTMKFLPGYVAIRLVNGKFQVEIPVTEHLDLTSCKDDAG